MKARKIGILFGLFLTQTVMAEGAVALMQSTKDNQSLGKVSFTQADYGVLIKPDLTGLKQGLHGFHLHQNPSCGDHGNSAQGHYDPQKTNTHQGPYGQGHLGDLPVLYVDAQGRANTPILTPRLKLKDLANLALMIHENGDNYTDTPPLGGGGPREACGLIGLH